MRIKNFNFSTHKVGNEKSPQSCILIHGAWHGGWAWKPVVNSIKKIGNFKEIVAPDLPGHGTKKMDFKNISLDTYTDSILELMKSMPKPITLIGHSMAGIIISKIAEHVPSEISQLIYVSGFIPDNGGSLLDEEKKAKNPSVALAVTIDEDKCSIKIDPEKLPYLFYNCCSEDYKKHAYSKIQEQPLLPFLSPVSLSQANFGSVKKFYIKCLKDNAIHPVDQERMYSKVACDVLTLDTDHSPFFSAGEELVKMIGTFVNEKKNKLIV